VEKKRIVLVNHKREVCGVYQYGLSFFNNIKNSSAYIFDLIEANSEEEFNQQIHQKQKPSALIVNYHPTTIPWVTRNWVLQRKVPIFGLMHEFDYVSAHSIGEDLFDFRFLPDPSIISRASNVFPITRSLPDIGGLNLPPAKEDSDIPIIGSFGFATPGKGFGRLVKMVQRDFDRAKIRLHIPPSFFSDPTGEAARKVEKDCRDLIEKKGIELEVFNSFASNSDIVKFLNQNTINLFLYNQQRGRGISSVIDFAILSQKPFGVSDCSMFRHLHVFAPEVFIGSDGIPGVIAKTEKTSKKLLDLCSPEKVLSAVENAVSSVLKSHESKEAFSFNTRLGHDQKENLKATFHEISQGPASEIFQRKNANAQIQYAFAKKTVDVLAQQLSPRPASSIKILSIDGENPTAMALKKQGYRITEIEDLFKFHSDSTTLMGEFDLIIAVSTLNYVRNDELYVSQLCDLLAPGGSVIFTMAYKSIVRWKDPIPDQMQRVYSLQDFSKRLINLQHSCHLLGFPHWPTENGDQNISYVSLVFQKTMHLTPEEQGFNHRLEVARLQDLVPQYDSSYQPGVIVDRMVAMEEKLTEKIDVLQHNVHYMKNSLSWKITEPLRNLASLKSSLKRLLNKPQ